MYTSAAVSECGKVTHNSDTVTQEPAEEDDKQK